MKDHNRTGAGGSQQEYTPDGAAVIADAGFPNTRHNRYLTGVDVVVPGPAVIATDVITLGSAVVLAPGSAIIFSDTDFTESVGQSLDGIQLALTVPDSTHVTLDDGSGTVVDIDATGTATGLAAIIQRMLFTQNENVRRYKLKAELLSGTGAYIKWCEDATNPLLAASWLQDPVSSESADVNHDRLYDSAGLKGDEGWTKWQELSKDPDDKSLSNLYFAGEQAASTWLIRARTE